MYLRSLIILVGVILAHSGICAQELRDSVVLYMDEINVAEFPEEVEVCISADNFDEVWSLSYTLDWNAGIFEYVDVSYMNPLVVFSLNEDLAPQGRLPALWYDPRVEGVSLDVQNKLMCLRFKVLRRPCNGEKIQMVSKPTEISITDDQDELPLSLRPAIVVGSGCTAKPRGQGG